MGKKSLTESKNKREQAIRERNVVCAIRSFLNQANEDHFYGCEEVDIRKLRELFDTLEQNHETTFPDFESNNACVELFKITSSKEKKNSSTQQKQDARFRKDVESRAAVISKVQRFCCHRETHSYKYLSKSLKRLCNNHYQSLKECGTKYTTKVFVIDHAEPDLHFSCPDGRCHGVYRLSTDKENLQWLKDNLAEVDYVFFITPMAWQQEPYIEVIKLSEIPKIISALPEGIVFCWAVSSTLSPAFSPKI